MQFIATHSVTEQLTVFHSFFLSFFFLQNISEFYLSHIRTTDIWFRNFAIGIFNFEDWKFQIIPLGEIFPDNTFPNLLSILLKTDEPMRNTYNSSQIIAYTVGYTVTIYYRNAVLVTLIMVRISLRLHNILLNPLNFYMIYRNNYRIHNINYFNVFGINLKSIVFN